MPIGYYGSIATVPADTIPTIMFSHELVVALETAHNHHFPMLLVAALTTALHKLSHFFIFGNKTPPHLAWNGQDPES
jgi:hypothetical protein